MGLSAITSNSAIRTSPSEKVSTSCAPGSPAIRTIDWAVWRFVPTMKSTPNAPSDRSQVRNSPVCLTRAIVNGSPTAFAAPQMTMFVSSMSVLAMTRSAFSMPASSSVSMAVPSPRTVNTSWEYVIASIRLGSVSMTTTWWSCSRLAAMFDPTCPAPTTITRTGGSPATIADAKRRGSGSWSRYRVPPVSRLALHSTREPTGRASRRQAVSDGGSGHLVDRQLDVTPLALDVGDQSLDDGFRLREQFGLDLVDDPV